MRIRADELVPARAYKSMLFSLRLSRMSQIALAPRNENPRESLIHQQAAIMRKLITTVLFSAITASAYAAPITFTDVVDPNPNHLFDGSSGSNATHSFTHSILDDGYDAATDAITSLSIALRFSDESNDAAAESVSFLFDGTVFGAQTITSGGSTFSATFSNPSLIALLADGAVTVTLNNAGTTTGNQNNRSDFLFLDSTLTVNVERSVASPIATPNAVPEPGSLALVALAMGAALLRRKPAV